MASLIVAVGGPVLQSRQSRWLAQQSSTGPVPPAAAGMTSLAVPAVMSANEVHGRATLIDAFVKAFERQRGKECGVRVLYGMGGTGKTTVALQVADRLQRRGFTVWFVSAAEPTDFTTGMRMLARQLGATAQELDRDWADNAPDVLWRHLDRWTRPWLLIVDNADNPRQLTPNGEAVARERGWTAARLMQMAKASEVLVSGAAYEAIRGFVPSGTVDARGEVALRGRSGPTPVYSIKL